ncbi:MAG TPA: CHASE domain-containing protein, partial [Nevskia sp.]|nr:CHASE domain-containing protein [Nevskia sp.]
MPPGYATAVWPPSGIALASLLLGGIRLWPGVWIGSFAVNVSTSWDGSSVSAILHSLAIAGGIASGAALQAALGTGLIRRFVGYTNIFMQEIDVVRILLIGGPLACLVNAAVGVGTLWAAGLIPVANLLFNWWTWWVGDTIGVLIFVPLICAWALRPVRQWYRRQITLSIPMAGMFAMVVLLFFFVSTREQNRLHAEFERTAQRAADQFQARIDNDLTILSAVSNFFESSDEVTREEFHHFVTEQLREHPDIRALDWVPWISAGQRPAYEATMRAAGIANYRIWERDEQGRQQVAADRKEYFPVAYIEPAANNTSALGYDIASEPKRSAALHAAIQSDSATASAAVPLVQDRQSRPGIVIALPVTRQANYRDSAEHPVGSTMGVCLAVFVIENLARDSLAELKESGLQLRLSDASPGAGDQLLFELGQPDQLRPAQIAVSRQLPLEVAGRHWALEFIEPADYVVAHRSWQAWGLLAVGLFITGLLGMLILVLIGRQAKVEELVLQQTAGLKAAERRFRRLLENTPDAMVIADRSGRIQLVNAQLEKLSGWSQDELIGQPIELLIPDRLKAMHVGHRDGYFGSPQVRPMGAGLELWARRKDGTEVPIEISLSPLETEEGTWATAAIRDISERKRVQRELAGYAQELQRSNQELEQFAYVASHDLQAPLRSIVGFGQILQTDYKGRLDADADTYLDFLVKSAAQMQSLIRDLLAFSRIGRAPDAHATADCAAVLEEVQHRLRPLIEER